MSSADQTARRLPGEVGIWVLIAGDVVVFSLFFITFLYYRGQQVELFSASQQNLSVRLGLLNTLILLTSSWFVANGVQAARRGLGHLVPRFFWLGFLCGLGFVVVKYFEYGAKLRAGITLTTNDFYMYYYMFTGIHLVHVLIGMTVLAFLARFSRSGELTPVKIGYLESGASFWHLVDLLWIVLFALLYLVR